MSAPVAITEGALAWYRKPLPLLAITAARLLAGMPPARIRGVLGALRRGAAPATAEQAQRARDAVVSTSVRCAGEGCLQRSIATALLCRLRGSWPTWCSGVRVVPFLGHAWVEVADVPIGEPYPPGYHQALIRIPPCAANRSGQPCP